MKNLILDFDGTLVDPTHRDYALYCDIMQEMGHDVLSLNTYWPLRCGVTPIGDVLKQSAGDNVDVARFVKMRLQRHEQLKYLRHDVPLPGVYEALDQLKTRFNLHLVSARASLENLTYELLKHGMRDYFTSVAAVCGPKHERITKIGDVVAVVGDTEHDILPAKELGIKAIAVCTGIRSREYLQLLAPDHVLDNICEVPGTIGA
jgi:phosphoglycolate phosphatase-like HAD superfamily hydrolase